jgi:hypothetical protein
MMKIDSDAARWQRGFNDGRRGIILAPVVRSLSYLEGYIEGEGIRLAQKATEDDAAVDVWLEMNAEGS